MANGIYRLERFFSKRKNSSTPSSNSNSPVTPTEPQFPSPSFIRPGGSRMTARKETCLKSFRSISALDGEYLEVIPDDTSPVTADLESSAPELPAIIRASSFDDGRCDSLFNSIYQFPSPPKDHLEQLPLVDNVDLESIFDGFTSDSSESSTASDTPNAPSTIERVDSPLSEAVNIDKFVDSLNKKLPAIPERTSSMRKKRRSTAGPATDWDLDDPAAVKVINNNLFKDIERSLGEAVPKSSLQHSSSEPLLSRAAWRNSRSSSPSSVLWGPDFTDFMSLSDDDIAESDMESSSVFSKTTGELPPTPPLTASSVDTSQVPRPRSLLTLSPPYASKPAAAAAFEAARIAARYDFDLVYVVNLWPDSTRPRTPSIGSEGSAKSVSGSPYHMTGRLLAAYGLEHVKSPFQVTTSVHTKILRSEGWIEYRSQEARDDEFARGYACSFFTGQYSRSNSIDSNMSAATQSSRKKIDRGVVFAAYRKPMENGGLRCSDAKELEALKQDAEGLVEMVIDMHATHRLRQAPLFTQQEDTGPMPAQNYHFS
ncbi:hypothetical protein LIA77_01236 [Sarocladium implicatum]|nr:hypothetical protein LIA77_01236 [Sarocladium implicatum]